MVTELQTHHADVTTHFAGQDLLIFGALSKPHDVINKVTSPGEDVAMFHKTTAGPFWLDGGKPTVRRAPSLFYLLSSPPIARIVKPDEQRRYGLHFANALADARADQPATAVMDDWQAAFRRLKKRNGDYLKLSNAVKLEEKTFFRQYRSAGQDSIGHLSSRRISRPQRLCRRPSNARSGSPPGATGALGRQFRVCSFLSVRHLIYALRHDSGSDPGHGSAARQRCLIDFPRRRSWATRRGGAGRYAQHT